MRKTLGLVIFVLSLLTLSINIMLGQIAYHIDKLDCKSIRIFPAAVFWLIGLSFLISIYLMLNEYLSRLLKHFIKVRNEKLLKYCKK